ncbi:S41 family peptidase [Pedobacter cryoconitis]|uniref:Peptidase S41-like protein n=1 Tax=Pedobacter cryoconitis TaxID=188932 RepID=A0A327SV94_9SPHI|nr:S41 family peptidase [Pedobacter cryoconitis]RAJ32265.1 peptidase S41-like protein [Pedobacter cryoconitis]
MKKIFILVLILLPVLSRAQTCNCADNFKSLVQRVKNNYVGYRDKVTEANQKKFDVFTDSLQQVAASAEKMRCFDICSEWLSFFEDGHIRMQFKPGKATKAEISAFFATSERTDWTERDFDKYLQDNKGKLDRIEGYWTYVFNTYKIAVVKDSSSKEDEFIGFIIKSGNPEWTPQQIKIRIKKVKDKYELIYFRGVDHGKNFGAVSLTGDHMNPGNFGMWYKSMDLFNKDDEGKVPVKLNQSPSFKILDEETNLLVIPYFAIKYKKSVDSILERNKALLLKTKHLIIDVRNNPGGLTGTFAQLLPYIYTNPIYTDGGVVWATADNIKDGYDTDMSDLSADDQKKFKKDVEKLKAHVGEFFPLYPADTIEFSQVLKNPQRVSVLMNRGSASSAEHFILRAEQSKKVTLFGQNSAGAIDYTEIVSGKIPCSYFSVLYPAFRSNRVERRRLNNIGINPDVIIPDSVSDWVEFVRTYKPGH